MISRGFWTVMTAAVVIWYSTITVYVAIRGFKDIKQMLARLKPGRDAEAAGGEASKP